MIIKGSSRAGPKQLGRHLQRTDTNENVHVLELQSPIENLTETLRDWQLIAEGTRGSKGLYHANIDPDARYKMTGEQWQRAVEVLEKELGLTGQPRAIVMHEKKGREHIHVVWQRTDIDSMILVSDSNNYYAHERASLALENEFGHEHVPGKHAKRDREKPPPKAEYNHAEWQQAERDGIDPRARKEAITDVFQRCDNGQAFRAALSDLGFVIAKGDRRDFVLVDHLGQVHSLARQINGVRAKELREFMADIDRENTPNIKEAKNLQKEIAKSPKEGRTPEPEELKPDQKAEPEAPKPEPDKPEPAKGPSQEEFAKIEEAVKARHNEETQSLRERQEVERKRTAEIFDNDIADKLKGFDAMQEAARSRYDREHSPERTGLDEFIDTVKAWINPEKAAEETRQRDLAREAFLQRLASDREVWLQQNQTVKNKDLADLTERHEQERREHTATYGPELARYKREHEAAQRLQRELEAEQQRTRDGPDPPGRTR